jgi:hypothetical protein
VFGACWLLACIEGISALDLAGRLVAALHTGTGLRAVRAGTATETEAARGTRRAAAAATATATSSSMEKFGDTVRWQARAVIRCCYAPGDRAFAPTINYYHIINTEGPCLMFDSSPNIPRRPVPASTLASSCARAAARRETVPWGLAPPIGTRSLLACT